MLPMKPNLPKPLQLLLHQTSRLLEIGGPAFQGRRTLFSPELLLLLWLLHPLQVGGLLHPLQVGWLIQPLQVGWLIHPLQVEGIEVNEQTPFCSMKGNVRTLVAKRMVVKGQRTLHFKQIPDGHVKMSVIKVIDGGVPLPVPLPDVRSVGEKKDKFIIWPTKLVGDDHADDCDDDADYDDPIDFLR